LLRRTLIQRSLLLIHQTPTKSSVKPEPVLPSWMQVHLREVCFLVMNSVLSSMLECVILIKDWPFGAMTKAKTRRVCCSPVFLACVMFRWKRVRLCAEIVPSSKSGVYFTSDEHWTMVGLGYEGFESIIVKLSSSWDSVKPQRWMHISSVGPAGCLSGSQGALALTTSVLR
jgi:hypothetical protein